MDFEVIKETMTKEEFLNNHNLTGGNGCPQKHGLINKKKHPCFADECQECWKAAIEDNNIKFKKDREEEQKVIEALKAVRDYCKKRTCPSCEFVIEDGDRCILAERLMSDCPCYWNVQSVEDHFKPLVTIYEVVHKEDGKHYLFISDEKLSLLDMVVCDTSQGKSYGRVMNIRQDINNDYKKCWKVK